MGNQKAGAKVEDERYRRHTDTQQIHWIKCRTRSYKKKRKRYVFVI